ncbi:Uma2 family endonuclease [Pullulanibacillus pueri]|uniref:Putative restriction endonuclease domain-containing protein n=1 Tax=Pullulanibacillus pueri TaxID=1437324 RepID=A0A8J2ZVY0_9BACL|nr:Uma2 family endonuclease [Pullulanibacillus pueri]MBM7682566.1 Uma2 family endonuclease [Pullulanibacillus pueri]GGH82325.1 hypothetical protein GCM10007096_21540 [Pullulanibacillus pueri]
MDRKKPSKKVQESPMTYNDYAKIDDGNRYELASGTLEMLSGSKTSHQLLNLHLSHLLVDSCGEAFIIIPSPIDVIFSDKDVRQPDLVAVHRSRINIITDKGIEGAPDLVIEILSPNSIKRDRRDKMMTYAQYRVPEYWLIDPLSRVLEHYLLNADHYLLHDVYADDQPIQSEKLACANFTMNALWARIPPLPNQ